MICLSWIYLMRGARTGFRRHEASVLPAPDPVVAVCCNELQSVSVRCSELQRRVSVLPAPDPVAACCCVLQCVLVCRVFCVLQCAVYCSVLQQSEFSSSSRPCSLSTSCFAYVEACCIVSQCVAVCCIVSQCVAVCRSVL